MTDVRAIVVIPARDEAQRIGACLQALAAQTIGLDSFATVVVLDACRDATAAVVAETGDRLGLAIRTIAGPGRGVGPARRIGMDAACARLLDAGLPDGLIATTDADSRVAPDWLERQLAHVARGARAIAGLIELCPAEAAALPEGVLAHRRRAAVHRLEHVRTVDPRAAHHHAGGASLAVTAEIYRRVGGMEPLPDLEDAAFAARLAANGIALLRPGDVRVHTSARRTGRAGRGLAVDLSRWSAAVGSPSSAA